MTTVRVLDPEEYDLLRQVPDGFMPDPENSVAVVALDDSGRLAGRMTVVVIPHLEGTWVREDFRGGTVAFRMEKAVIERMRELGPKKLLAFVVDETHEGYMERLGYRKLQMTVWEKEI